MPAFQTLGEPPRIEHASCKGLWEMYFYAFQSLSYWKLLKKWEAKELEKPARSKLTRTSGMLELLLTLLICTFSSHPQTLLLTGRAPC